MYLYDRLSFYFRSKIEKVDFKVKKFYLTVKGKEVGSFFI